MLNSKLFSSTMIKYYTQQLVFPSIRRFSLVTDKKQTCDIKIFVSLSIFQLVHRFFTTICQKVMTMKTTPDSYISVFVISNAGTINLWNVTHNRITDSLKYPKNSKANICSLYINKYAPHAKNLFNFQGVINGAYNMSSLSTRLPVRPRGLLTLTPSFLYSSF